MTLRCGLVGVGHWTATALLPAVRKTRQAEVVACVGATLEEAATFAAQHHLTSCRASLSEMIEREALDVCIVATPDHLHPVAVRELLNSGVAVYCEKPLANDAPSAWDLVEVQARTGVPATVGYSFRFNPAVQALKRDLEAGLLGEPWLIELAEHNPQFHPHSGKPMNWKGDPAMAAGGALFEYGSHVVDLGMWLLGPVARVSSSFKRVLDGAKLDDIAVLQMTFESGAQGTLIASWVLSGGFPGTRIKLHGSEAVGEVVIDDRLPKGQSYHLEPAFRPGGEDRQIEPLGHPHSDAATRHVAAFLSSIRKRDAQYSTLPTLRQAARVQDVLAAALLAEQHWQDVVAEPGSNTQSKGELTC